MFSIMREAIRSLESCLDLEYHRKVAPLSRQELEQMTPHLYHIQEWKNS